MKLEKFNPFVTARLNAGYKSQNAFAKVINVSRPTYSQWEQGKYASVYEHTLTGFKKMCDIFGWTYEEGLNNLSNLNKWRKDPNVNIVNPTMEQAKAMVKTWKPELATLDTSNTDISKEIKMIDNPLKVWRGQKNLTRSEAAKLCHVDVNVYSDCEDGIKKPNGYDLTKILKGTGLGFLDIQKIFSDDTVKEAIENAITESKNGVISIQLCDEIDHNKIIEDAIANSKNNNGSDIIPDQNEPAVIAEASKKAKPTKIDESKQDPMQKKLANQTVSYLKEENVLDNSNTPANNSRNIAISKQTAKYILRTLYGTLDYNEYYKILSEFTKGGLNL